MWQTNKQTIILLTGGLFVLLILCVSASFLYSFINTESLSIRAAETTIAALEYKEKDLINAKNDLSAFKKENEKIERSFLTEESFVSFLKLLEEIAGKSGVKIQIDRAILPNSASGKAELNFMIRGNYSAIAFFFILFDQIPYAGIVDQISIMPDGTAKNMLISRAHYIILNFSTPQ